VSDVGQAVLESVVLVPVREALRFCNLGNQGKIEETQEGNGKVELLRTVIDWISSITFTTP
jgi:hypothetical protein